MAKTISYFSRSIACVLSVVLAALLCVLAPSAAYAADSISDAGWTYYYAGTQKGTLKITGTMNDWGDDSTGPFWDAGGTLHFSSGINKVVVTSGGKLKTALGLFFDCENLTMLEGFENLNTDSVKNMRSMFNGCRKLASTSALAEIEKLNTSKVTNMSSMFVDCNKISSLDLSGWDVSNVENMGSMFYYCTSLTSIDVSAWDASNVTRTAYMFSNCPNLASVDVSNWNVANLTNADSMFKGCRLIETLDFSTWDTSKATSATDMFGGMDGLRVVTVGDKFAWHGANGPDGEQVITLPTGHMWVSSADGKAYDGRNLPDNVAATYTWAAAPTDIQVDEPLRIPAGGALLVTPSVAPAEASWVDLNYSVDSDAITVEKTPEGCLLRANGTETGTAHLTVYSDYTADYGTQYNISRTFDIETYDSAVHVEGVSLDRESATLALGQTESVSLTATVSPANASNLQVFWTTSDPDVATVDQTGVVTAKGQGSATITAITADGAFETECAVTVVQPTTGISLDQNELSLYVGDSSQLSATVSPDDATDKSVIWETSDSGIAAVDQNGAVEAVGSGVATITATAVDGGIAAECTVTVGHHVAGITLDRTSIEVPKGGCTRLVPIIEPADAMDKAVTWSSSNTTNVTVDADGVVSVPSNALSLGLLAYTVTATTEDGSFTATCSVKIKGTKVTGVALDQTSLAVPLGDSASLTATVSPSGASDKTVLWSSSDESVATVEATGTNGATGAITTVSAGQATITATTREGLKTAQCVLTVTQPVTGIALAPKSVSILKDSSTSLTATVEPFNAFDKSLIWESSDESVATVEDGVVSGVGGGTATITATTHDGGYSDTCEVEVIEGVRVTGISLDKDELTLDVGETDELTATIEPAEATISDITWVSSADDIATVDSSGTVSAHAPGYAEIAAVTVDGSFVAVCEVTVIQPVTSVALDKETLSLIKGDAAQLTATVLPTNASYPDVAWTSGSPSVATVDETGLVRAVGTGTAVISATCADGEHHAQCSVTVTQPVTGIALDQDMIEIDEGDSVAVVASVQPEDATNRGVSWRSSNSAIASVSPSGVILGRGRGEAIITATTDDGEFRATCRVAVYQPVRSLTITPASVLMYTSDPALPLQLDISPGDANDKTVTWDSSNWSVVAISSQKLWTRGPGTATVTATSSNGVQARCEVIVRQSIDSISVSPASATLKAGQTVSLEAEISPANADERYTWSSIDPSVATVDQEGTVTAVGVGMTRICASSPLGVRGYCTLTVEPPDVVVTGVSVSPSALPLYIGGTSVLAAVVSPDDAGNKAVKWKSSDPSVVTVSTSGKVTALQAGEATITATTLDGGFEASCVVTVSKDTTAADIVIALINGLPSADQVTVGDGDAIRTAQAAYGQLSADDQAYVNQECGSKLGDAAVALAAAVAAAEQAAQQAAVDAGQFAELAATLPTGEVTLADEEAIATVRAAYDALSPVAKALVDADILARLGAAEQALQVLKDAAEQAQQDAAQVVEAIRLLPGPDEATLEDKDSVAVAQQEYSDLSPAAKLLADEALEAEGLSGKLESVAAAVQAIEDAAPVIALVEALPDGIGIGDEGAVVQARAAYDALSPAAQALVDSACETKLGDAERALQAAKAAAEQAEAEVAEVIELVGNLPAVGSLNIDDADTIAQAQAAVAQAQEALAALGEEAQAIVNTACGSKLADAQTYLNDVEAAASVVSLIRALPAAADVDINDEGAIVAARDAYNALSLRARELANEKCGSDLADAETALGAAKAVAEQAARDQAAAAPVVVAIRALPVADKITISDETAITIARAAYNALPPAAQALVDAACGTKLADVTAALQAAKDAAASEQSEPGGSGSSDGQHVHKLVKVAAVPATCGRAGSEAYWKCSACPKLFSDSTGKHAISKPASIPATGKHSWDAGTVTKEPTAKAEGVRTFTCSACGATKTEAIPKLVPGKDGTDIGPGASAGTADFSLTTKAKGESEPAGTAFKLLQAKVKKISKTSITLGWTKVKGAKKYIVYGNKCGKGTTRVKIATTAKRSKKLKKVAGKKIKAKTFYKFNVVALDKNGKVISTSKTIHTITKGSPKYCNEKKVAVSKPIRAKAQKLKVGANLKLKAKAVKESKKLKLKQHRKIAYESSNPKVASVTSKGVVKAKKKGACYIYAYAQNGVCAKVKVVVKGSQLGVQRFDLQSHGEGGQLKAASQADARRR